MTVAPARPGPNLVRVDVARSSTARARGSPTRSGSRSAPVPTTTARAGWSRPGRVPASTGSGRSSTSPPGAARCSSRTGRRHRVPFAVETGRRRRTPAAWTGADGPECVAAATAAVLAGGRRPVVAAPPSELDDSDRAALASVVDTLAERGVEELAVRARRLGPQRRGVRRRRARPPRQPGLDVVDADGRTRASATPCWWSAAGTDAARRSRRSARLPLRQQPIRSDGTWLAPWLLSPGVVDSTAGRGAAARLRHPRRRRPGVQPDPGRATSPARPRPPSGYAAWRAARGGQPGPTSGCTQRRARPTCPPSPATPATRPRSPGSPAAPSPRSAPSPLALHRTQRKEHVMSSTIRTRLSRVGTTAGDGTAAPGRRRPRRRRRRARPRRPDLRPVRPGRRGCSS